METYSFFDSFFMIIVCDIGKKIKNALLEASNAASEFVINNFEGDFDVFNKGIIEGENLVTSIDKVQELLGVKMDVSGGNPKVNF